VGPAVKPDCDLVGRDGDRGICILVSYTVGKRTRGWARRARPGATGGSSSSVNEGDDFVEGRIVAVAGVDFDLGYVELDALEAVVACHTRLLVDEVCVGVCASRGVLGLPALNASTGGLGRDLAVHDPDVREPAQGLQVRAPKPVLKCRFGYRGDFGAQE
jgi:hypothetical protein